ncbi:MAG: MFS transporter [Deltaproteobacteria bacterium]|nr:MFS transporter [Deltaproteobacteria bacterium]
MNYSWVIVGVSFISVGLAYGVWYSFSVFFVAILDEFGWSRSLAAGAFSLFAIIHGTTGPFVGGMVDRFGPRRVILFGSLLLGVGLVLSSLTRIWWHYYLFFGLITAAGVGTTGWVPNTTLIQQWFKANRGLAIGIISSGIGVGILVCVPSVQHLINGVGWRMAYRIMGLCIPLIVGTSAVVFLRRSPETTSPRDTAVPEKDIIGTAAEAPPILDEEWTPRAWTVRQALSTKQFRFLCVALPLGPFITQSILAHQVAFFVDQGVDTLLASYIVGIVGITSVGTKILWGTLSDRIGREVTYTMGIICGVCGIIVLIIFSVHPFSILKYSYGILFGMGYAAVAALPAIITADFFEGRGYGSVFGTLMFLMGIGAASGAWLAGFLHDQVGSYVPVFIIMIACALLACLNIWMAAPRKIRNVSGKRRGFHPSV